MVHIWPCLCVNVCLWHIPNDNKLLLQSCNLFRLTVLYVIYCESVCAQSFVMAIFMDHIIYYHFVLPPFALANVFQVKFSRKPIKQRNLNNFCFVSSPSAWHTFYKRWCGTFFNFSFILVGQWKLNRNDKIVTKFMLATKRRRRAQDLTVTNDS